MIAVSIFLLLALSLKNFCHFHKTIQLLSMEVKFSEKGFFATRPCETHVVHLRDRVGQMHRLSAEVGCRNTLFNGRISAQELHDDLGILAKLGVTEGTLRQ